MTREQRRRDRRQRDRRLSRADLAAGLEAPSAPLVWGAGWPGRIAAAGAGVLFVVLVDHPPGVSLTHPQPGELLFAVWTSLVAAWLCCRLCLWRITADRDGVYIRRLWTVQHLPWSVIGRVELRNDGLLEFFGAKVEPMAGLFAPPSASRLSGLRGTGVRAADMLTVLVLNADLRPRAQADRTLTGVAFARWALPLVVVLHVVADWLSP